MGNGGITSFRPRRVVTVLAAIVLFFFSLLSFWQQTQQQKQWGVAVSDSAKSPTKSTAAHQEEASPYHQCSPQWPASPHVYLPSYDGDAVDFILPLSNSSNNRNASYMTAVCIVETHALGPPKHNNTDLWPAAYHFPHALQQMLACWSWWRKLQRKDHHQQQRKAHFNLQKVLVWNKTGYEEFGTSAFVDGLLDVLQSPGGGSVSVVENLDNRRYKNDSSVVVVRPSLAMTQRELYHSLHVTNTTPRPNFATYQTPRDAQSLADATLRHLGLQRQRTSEPSSPSSNSSASSPCGEDTVVRVAVLNRRKQMRKLLNAEDITTALQLQPGLNVSLYYFENATFGDQVQTFLDHDIIVSPHGAQLSGIVFASASHHQDGVPSQHASSAASCTTVLELFSEFFIWPRYFGSLATLSGLRYAYLHVAPDDPDAFHPTMDEIGRLYAKYSQARLHNRARPTCALVSSVVETVMAAAKAWRACSCKPKHRH